MKCDNVFATMDQSGGNSIGFSYSGVCTHGSGIGRSARFGGPNRLHRVHDHPGQIKMGID